LARRCGLSPPAVGFLSAPREESILRWELGAPTIHFGALIAFWSNRELPGATRLSCRRYHVGRGSASWISHWRLQNRDPRSCEGLRKWARRPVAPPLIPADTACKLHSIRTLLESPNGARIPRSSRSQGGEKVRPHRRGYRTEIVAHTRCVWLLFSKHIRAERTETAHEVKDLCSSKAPCST
jgi:hypothetical protein